MGYHVLKLGKVSPSLESVQEFGPQNVQKPKMDDSEAKNSKTTEDGAILSASGKQRRSSIFSRQIS